MKAMILAAGTGTRLGPLTDHTPKALVKVGGKPMLETTIRYLQKYGVDSLVVNVHHFADQIKNYLSDNQGFDLSYQISDEQDRLMNTGGAILKAQRFLKDEKDFVLTSVDVLTNLDLSAMIEKHREKKALVTLAVKERKTTRSLLFNNEMHLQGWRDNRTGQIRGNNSGTANIALGFSAIHVINTLIFDLITENGPFSIIDLYLRLMNDHTIYGFRHDESDWMEFGRYNELPEQENDPVFRTLMQAL